MKRQRVSKRIQKIKLVSLLMCLVMGLVACETSGTAEKAKPHILLIFTDQQNASMLSAAGNSSLQTPAMDLLAREGVRFSQAYCTSPVCGPARSSIISGFMPHETGVEWNGQSMKEEILNAGELFRENGYQTVWGGKWHLPVSYPQSAEARIKTIKGFEVLPFWEPEKERWFLGAETDPPLTKAVVDYINNYDGTKPLFMAVSYHNPHDICMYPRKAGWVTENDSLLEIRHYGFKHQLPVPVGTNPNQIENLPPLPANHQIESDEPEFIAEKRRNHDEYGVETKLANLEFGDKEWQGYLNAYSRLTERVDVEIGKVLAALKEKGMWENTLIVFTSDHGDGAAAHKWAAKLSFYEEASKIPMIVVYPGKIPGGKTDEQNLASQIDILPTMLAYANIETEIPFTGKSLKTVMDDQAAPWRDFLVVELADFKKDSTRKGRMVRADQYKYNLYSTGEEQLFDLQTDPGEMHNLIGTREFEPIREKSRKNLQEWAEKTRDSFALEMLGNENEN